MHGILPPNFLTTDFFLSARENVDQRALANMVFAYVCLLVHCASATVNGGDGCDGFLSEATALARMPWQRRYCVRTFALMVEHGWLLSLTDGRFELAGFSQTNAPSTYWEERRRDRYPTRRVKRTARALRAECTDQHQQNQPLRSIRSRNTNTQQQELGVGSSIHSAEAVKAVPPEPEPEAEMLHHPEPPSPDEPPPWLQGRASVVVDSKLEKQEKPEPAPVTRGPQNAPGGAQRTDPIPEPRSRPENAPERSLGAPVELADWVVPEEELEPTVPSAVPRDWEIMRVFAGIGCNLQATGAFEEARERTAREQEERRAEEEKARRAKQPMPPDQFVRVAVRAGWIVADEHRAKYLDRPFTEKAFWEHNNAVRKDKSIEHKNLGLVIYRAANATGERGKKTHRPARPVERQGGLVEAGKVVDMSAYRNWGAA